MKEAVLKYLMCDYLNYLDMIYALEHDATIIHFSKQGIILKFKDIYMLAIKDQFLARKLLCSLDDCKMLVIHNDCHQALVKEKFGLKQEIVAYQYGYFNNQVKVINVPGIVIKEIGMEYFDFIKQNYSTPIEEEYLIDRIEANVFIGAFDQGKLVGFVGIHEEGSIGFLEVIAEYRHRKVAMMLETHMIDRRLKENELIYLQVEIENIASMRLHEKLGFMRSSDIVTWYM